MSKVEDFVFQTFLELVQKTVPHGSEDIFVEHTRHLFPKDLQQDQWGNYFYQIGNTRSIFAAHLDTVSKEYKDVHLQLDGNLIKTDGRSTLGADDKAGVTILLWMIKNKVPGMYYFFIGEEVGCIGSGDAAKNGLFKGQYDRIISFDRRNISSVITYQSSSRCCSDKFADALCEQLNQSSGLLYKKDTGGIYTDSAEFTHLIPECTNISVGYYKEHTPQESQDIKHLTTLAAACIKVDWENLPTERNPEVQEQQHYDYPYYSEIDYTNEYSRYDYGNYHSEICDAGMGLPNRGKKKRNRRGSSVKYWDSGSGLEDISAHYEEEDFYDVVPISTLITGTNSKAPKPDPLYSDSKYDWILSKLADSTLEQWELEIIREQYLDMEQSYDKFFYDYLLEQMYETGGSDII